MYLYGRTMGTPAGAPTDIIAPSIGKITVSSQPLGGYIVGIDIDRSIFYQGATSVSTIDTGGRPIQYLAAGFTGGVLRTFGVSTEKSFSEFPTVGAFITVDIASPPVEALHLGRPISDRTNVGTGDPTFPYMVGFRIWRMPQNGPQFGTFRQRPIIAIAAIYLGRCPAGQVVDAGQCVAKIQCTAPATYVPATQTSRQKCACPATPTGYEYIGGSCTLVKSIPVVQTTDVIGIPSGRGVMQSVFSGTPVAYALTWDFILGQKALTGIMLRDATGKSIQVGAPGSSPTLLEQPMSGIDYTTASDATVQTIFTAMKLLTTPVGGVGVTRRVRQIIVGYEPGGPIRGFEISYATETCPAATYVGGSSTSMGNVKCLPLCKPDDVRACICADPIVGQLKKDGSPDVWNYTRCGWESTLPALPAPQATPVGTMAASVQTTTDYGSSVSAYTPTGVPTPDTDAHPDVGISTALAIKGDTQTVSSTMWVVLVFLFVLTVALWFTFIRPSTVPGESSVAQ